MALCCRKSTSDLTAVTESNAGAPVASHHRRRGSSKVKLPFILFTSFLFFFYSIHISIAMNDVENVQTYKYKSKLAIKDKRFIQCLCNMWYEEYIKEADIQIIYTYVSECACARGFYCRYTVKNGYNRLWCACKWAIVFIQRSTPNESVYGHINQFIKCQWGK